MKQQTEQSVKLTSLTCVGTTKFVALAKPVLRARNFRPLVFLVGLVVAAGLALASFPGENGLIVFDTAFGSASQIYTIRPNGSDMRQLTGVSEGGTALMARWSADGRSIVYSSDRTGNFEVFVMNADGSGKRQLTADSGFNNSWPSFSRDGSTIVFSRCSHFLGTCDVMLMRSDGSNIRTLVGGYWHHNQTVFSPHGMQIAFTTDEGGYDALLWTMNADGTNRKSVTEPQVRFSFATDRSDWSPDGARITFSSLAGGIFTIRPDGTNLRALTSNDSIFGTYSPDGRKMVLLGPAGLSIMNADGSGIAPIPGTPAGVALSDWAVAK